MQKADELFWEHHNKPLVCDCVYSRLGITQQEGHSSPVALHETYTTQDPTNATRHIITNLGFREDCKTTCSLPETMDVHRWHSVLRAHHQNPPQGPATYARRYYTCGQYFQNTRALDDHIHTATTLLPRMTHGSFCDECPRGGGCYNILNLRTGEIIRTRVFRAPIRGTAPFHSTAGEAECWREAIDEICDIDEITSDSSVTFATDSSATKSIVEGHVIHRSTLSHTLKCPTIEAATVMRATALWTASPHGGNKPMPITTHD